MLGRLAAVIQQALVLASLVGCVWGVREWVLSCSPCAPHSHRIAALVFAGQISWPECGALFQADLLAAGTLSVAPVGGRAVQRGCGGTGRLRLVLHLRDARHCHAGESRSAHCRPLLVGVSFAGRCLPPLKTRRFLLQPSTCGPALVLIVPPGAVNFDVSCSTSRHDACFH